MSLILAALVVLLAGGVLSLAGGRGRWACILGPAVAVSGSVLALTQAMGVLISGQAATLQLAWHVPLGSLSLGLDPLSAVFVVPIAVVTALAAIYGGQYLGGHDEQVEAVSAAAPVRARKHLGAAWLFANVLTAAMLLVVLARNGVLFLFAWELMALSSFFLVMFEHEDEQVRRAGWTYLVASHLGTAFLLAMFVLLGRHSPTLDFATFHVEAGLAGTVFVLGVIGFGTKAGFVPLHIWLPEAHPAAPSHVSAIMSGVMIKTGLYGLLRLITLLGPVPAWWGWLLVGVGVVTGILGIGFALAQHDLKRLLAYSSVENVGIMALGLGTALLGLSADNARMATLGFAGCLLHMVNHATFKSLLFLGAGAVLHATGTRQLDHLGGLLKRMPTTGATFLLGAAAICGLPPLNGFVSELLIYLAAFAGLTGPLPPHAALSAAAVVVIGALALIGGLAAACFAKACGAVFLGEPRTASAAQAHEAGLAMRLPMLILAACCPLIGLLGWLAPRALAPAIATLMPPAMAEQIALETAWAARSLGWLALGGAVFGGLVLLLIAGRVRLLSRREVGAGPTWDCGYANPQPRMQYTASSFADPLVRFLKFFLQTREEVQTPRGLFPDRAWLHTETPDVFREGLYRRLFAGGEWLAVKLHRLQHGRIQVYVLYIALMLLVLLVWKLG
jgi:hydrogenase-4 component B